MQNQPKPQSSSARIWVPTTARNRGLAGYGCPKKNPRERITKSSKLAARYTNLLREVADAKEWRGWEPVDRATLVFVVRDAEVFGDFMDAAVADLLAASEHDGAD